MPVRERSQEDIDAIVKQFREGATLQELGDSLGISRARAQQILKKAGVESKEGGSAKRAQLRAQTTEKQRDSQETVKAKKYGLSLEQFRKLKEDNGNGVYMNDPESLFYGYMMYKRNQIRHYPDVPFNLSFMEWNDLWSESPLERNKNNWMIRKDRTKPFDKKNMQIVPSSDAIREIRCKQ